jgi:hypothetical protein
MTPGFVAAVLEGFEGTLECVLDRLEEGDLKREVAALLADITAKRALLDGRTPPESMTKAS